RTPTAGPTAGRTIVLPPESRWHPVNPRLRRLLPVPPVLVALTWAALATVSVLPERGDDWRMLPGFMTLVTVLVCIGTVAMATTPDKSFVRFRYHLTAQPGMALLTVIAGVGCTADLVGTGDPVTMACGVLSLAWMVTLLMAVFATPRRAPVISPWRR
ncbi:MAG: hypothetical protein Q4F67_16815, partial [Propionibacteriaceae bacterium]|nr:hypothetical protein [Propionibacteriaceae bacterium]